MSASTGRTRRSPVRYALALVVVVTATGAGLRWWGPVNPALHVNAQVRNATASGGGFFLLDSGPAPRHAPIELSLANHSHSQVRVVGLRLRASWPWTVVGWHLAGVDGVDTVLGPGGRARLRAELTASRVCALQPRSSPWRIRPRVDVVVDVRTASGRVKTVDGPTISISCGPSTTEVGILRHKGTGVPLGPG